MAFGPIYKLPKIRWLFVLVTFGKIKVKTRLRSTYPKT